MTDPVRPADAGARALAARLLAEARHGALATLDPGDGSPVVTRVAVLAAAGGVLILISDLSGHAAALAQDPRASLLVGEPGPKGDPLTHPRLTLVVRAEPADKLAHRQAWLTRHPKARLYFDFADFRLVELRPVRGLLNGGFGRAYRLGPDDLPDA